MQPPAHIDMSLIREAIARRQAGGVGGSPQGGVTLPAAAQQSQPGGLTPTGQPNTPGQPQPQPPLGAVPGGMPQGAPGGGGAPQQSGVPPQKPQANFDDETKSVGKALISQLLKYL